MFHDGRVNFSEEKIFFVWPVALDSDSNKFGHLFWYLTSLDLSCVVPDTTSRRPSADLWLRWEITARPCAYVDRRVCHTGSWLLICMWNVPGSDIRRIQPGMDHLQVNSRKLKLHTLTSQQTLLIYLICFSVVNFILFLTSQPPISDHFTWVDLTPGARWVMRRLTRLTRQ